MLSYDQETQEVILTAAQASSQPICIYGLPGCGKSRLINLAWARAHPSEAVLERGPVSINIDDSVDAKSLVGTFRSSLTEPGRFEWVDGLLVELIRRGRWLVLEDVDKVNSDILSILPREGDEHFSIPETGEKVKIHPNFGLIGTSTLQNVKKLRKTLPSWLLLECGYPTDLVSIVNDLLPMAVGSLVLAAFNAVMSSTAQKGHYERSLGLHDLFRGIHRVRLILPSLRLGDSSSFITEFQKSKIGIHLCDIFANHSPFPERRSELVASIESALESGPISSDACPAFSSDPNSISIGDDLILQRRCVLSTNSEACLSSFTLTSVHLRTMQRVGRGISHSEGILVVGDTGVGKTTTIQFLANQLGVKMHVYNFSDQTEGSDLIGGLKPVTDMDKLISECEALIRDTLNQSESGQAVIDYIRAKSAKRDMQAVIKAIEKTAAKAIVLFQEKAGHEESLYRWKELMSQCLCSGKVFRFVPGPLVKAVENGDWILLDEINLAPPDVLRILNGLLENQTVVIPETGQVIKMHSEFRLFAAMNPPHLGKGKKALPPSLRSRFTEIYCSEVTERSDLIKLVHQSLERDLTVNTLTVVVPKIVDLYIKLKTDSTVYSQLSSLEGGAPIFSLRSLSRSLEFAKRLIRSPKRSYNGDGTLELVDGLKVSLTSAIDSRSEGIVSKLIDSVFPTPANMHVPKHSEAQGWTLIEGHWIATGTEELPDCDNEQFIVTESVKRNLRKLSICLAGGPVARPPILCEGSTGAGKTSLVTFLSRKSGHRLVRINNHEHTDLQDYFGQYVSNVDGGLSFQEGPLVSAVRNGYWVLLDELNLAPTEVLEALNRLLDDNRELVIPETSETIKAHPDFVLFATQNPVTLEYAGRKSLSRAFRNRFVDVQIDELPGEELGSILSLKCRIAESTAKRMLATYTELSRLRRLDRVLSGRDSALVTVRDLIRWALRGPTTREEIALEGYLILAERLRTDDQRTLVRKVLEDKIGVTNLDSVVSKFYQEESSKVLTNALETSMVRTDALNRSVALVSRAMAAGESVLVVGETGTGKTSAVQLCSQLFKKSLRIINCHQHLESGDLIGQVGPCGVGRLAWKDGPLVEACRDGSWILLDEVNLADDSVVERLNSLLDIDFRGITLAEKPREETVVAHEEFRLLFTMNPGNDFGKKELSAALRNRFTEIWVDGIDFDPTAACPTGYSMVHSLLQIADEGSRKIVAEKISRCINFAIKNVPSLHVSSRDALMWCSFVNKTAADDPRDMLDILGHGAALVLLDPLDPTSPEYSLLVEYVGRELEGVSKSIFSGAWIQEALTVSLENVGTNSFGPFEVPSSATFNTGNFSLKAPTSAKNFGRLLRAMFGSRRPILLHGDPGAGKSSVVAALARYCGVHLVRINLSDQTELADILGQNVPIDGGKFEWKDGILLEAISRGDWVLLDELNLAPQPVLEGLNALLDHRSEIYVPAIDRLVKCPPTFRLFSTQNEAKKGDGRKMLPRSLISRFSRLRVSALQLEDLAAVAAETLMDDSTVPEAIDLISKLTEKFSDGVGWNLRDLSRLLRCVSVRGQLTREIAWMVLGARLCYGSPARSEGKRIVYGSVAPRVDAMTYLSPNYEIPCEVDLLEYQAEAVACARLALSAGCHVILTGEPGSGKLSLLRLLCRDDLVEIRMHSQMDTSDLIGQFSQKINSMEFQWNDSPLTIAVRSGGCVVLKNAHCCPPAILDRLNALIEDDGVLVIPEKGEAETVVPHSNFRLVLITDKPNMLSHAIRNRCVEISIPAGTESKLIDKYRVSRNIVNFSESSFIAANVDSVQAAHQASLLRRAGLDLHVSVQFITQRDPRPSKVALEEAVISRGSRLFDRQLALLKSTKFQRNIVETWIIESAVSVEDLEVRLGKRRPISADLWGSNPVNRHLTSRLLLSANLPDTLSPVGLGQLHGLVAGTTRIDRIEETDNTCYDFLLRWEGPIQSSCLKFSGAYRDSSVDLFSAILNLGTAGVPSSALVDLAATAVALRFSTATDASGKELQVLSAISQQNHDESTANDDMNRAVSRALRLLNITDIETLVRAEIKLTESDLVLAGLGRAADWSVSCDIEAERLFTVLMNKFTIAGNSTLTGTIADAIRLVSEIACGDIESTLKKLHIIGDSFGTSSVRVTGDVDLLVNEIQSYSIPEEDVHALRRMAVDQIGSETEALANAGETYRACCEISAVGVDETGICSLIELLKKTSVSLECKGIYVRPTDATIYSQLRYLVCDLQKQLTDIIRFQKVSVLISFAATIAQPLFRHYADITRPISFAVVQLAHALIASKPVSIVSVPIPLEPSRIENPEVLLSLMSPDDLVPSVGRSLVYERISKMCERPPVPTDDSEDSPDQVIIQGDVEISLASMVEDNDKARADAAVKKLHRELFPNTYGSFINELKGNEPGMGDQEDENDSAGVVPPSVCDLDRLAAVLVTEEKQSVKEILTNLASTMSETVDCPELVALSKLRLERTITELETLFVSSPTPLQLEDEEDDVIDNREQKLRLSEFIKSGKGGVASFYSPRGGKEAVAMLSSPFRKAHTFLNRLQSSVMEISDHPDLVHAISVVSKALQLPTDCSAICALQSGEYVLQCLQKLESAIPSRYWQQSTDAVPMLTQLIARLRASEVASWKDLRSIRETVLAKSGSGKWLVHLWRIAIDTTSNPLEIFDLTLGWLRNSGIGQLGFRLDLLQRVGSLTNNFVLAKAYSVAQLWLKPVKGALREARAELNKSVTALVKEIQFRLGGRHYSAEKFRLDIKRSHLQLAAVLKRFEETISGRVEDVVAKANIPPPTITTEASEIADWIRETMEAIRSAPRDKSSKLMKQRLVADLTSQMREELVTSKKQVFSVRPLIECPSPIDPYVVLRSMVLANLEPLCKNNDVKPVILVEWRSIASYYVSALAEACIARDQSQHEKNIELWRSRSDSQTTQVETIRNALSWLDEMDLLVHQFNILNMENIRVDISKPDMESADSIRAQIFSDSTIKCLYVSGTDIRRMLPSHLRTVSQLVFDNPSLTSLFATSKNRLQAWQQRGVELACELESLQLNPLDVVGAPEMLEGEKKIDIGDVLSVIDFAVFLHEEGICSQDSDEQDAKGEGSVEWTSGTGLGEGQGVNDKSEEIEDAAQFDTEKSQQETPDEEKDEADETDQDKGIDANADQGMNEPDVEESGKERNEEDENQNEDREMGDVDMNDGGEIDEEGGTRSDDEDEKDADDKNNEEDEIEIKNDNIDTRDDDEDDQRAQEKPTDESKDNQGETDDKKIDDDVNDENDEEEISDAEEEDDEKFEAFLDTARQDDMPEQEEQEENEDDIGDLDEDLGTDEEVDPADEPEQELEEAKGPVPEDQEEELKEDVAAGIDASTGGDDSGAQQERQSAPSSTAEKSSSEDQKEGTSNGANEQMSASKDKSGTDTTNKGSSSSSAEKPTCRPAPSPLEPNNKEALDDWLKDIRELIAPSTADKAMNEDTAGDVGELDDTSAQAAMGMAPTESVPTGIQDTESTEESVNESNEEDPNGEAGINRDDVIMNEEDDQEPPTEEEVPLPDTPEQVVRESETGTAAAEKKKRRSTVVVENPEIPQQSHLPDEILSDLAPVVVSPSNQTATVPVEEMDESTLCEIELKANRLSNDLSEKLLAVLEPTKRGRLEGFFKTGKRISMRRVLSWIASDYRKDKFWLRRTRPSHREYRIMICMDNTLSMRNNGVGEMALICVSALAQSLQLLEVGKIGLLSFGTAVSEICPLDSSMSTSLSVRDLARDLRFNEESTSSFSDAFPAVVYKCSEVFRQSDEQGSLALVITDGRFDKDRCRPYVQELIAQGHVPVLIVMDANKEESILSVTSVFFEEDNSGPTKKRKIVRKPFLSQSDCPFPFYAVIQEPSQLPSTLADILRQWIEIYSPHS